MQLNGYYYKVTVSLVLTSVGEFWSGQKDSGTGQCPIGTPVLGFGLTYMSLWQLCQGWDPKGLDISGCPSITKKLRQSIHH